MNKLEQLQELRERAGIQFEKSFRCEDAEKNIHLLDKDQFFKKFTKRIKEMGYSIDEDFDFDVIRHKYSYAERHHIGQTYEWKYFYSTTFTITDELIEYLLKHNYIYGKEKKSKNKTTEDKILDWQKIIDKNYQKIKEYKEFIRINQKTQNLQTIENYKRAIENSKSKIENCKIKITELENKKGEK